MKLKNRDWTERERTLAAAPQPLQQDRTVRTALLAIVFFGVAVLASVASYLVCLSSTPQDIDARGNVIRFWRSL